jgi:hypothetical protein
MPRLSRITLTLLLATLFAASAGLAQTPTRPTLRPLGPVTLVSENLFVRLWNLLTHYGSKNGCGIDPSGQCLPVGSGATPVENGCQADPDGCLAGQSSSPQADNGCGIDPDGRCIK